MTFYIAHQPGTAEFYWAIVSDASIVVWATLLLLAPRRAQGKPDPRRVRLVGFVAALVAALVVLAAKTIEVWPGHPLFPSGHTAFAVTIAVFLVARDLRWLALVVPLLALLAVALVLARYHIVADIGGGLVVGLFVGGAGVAALHRWTAPRVGTRSDRPAGGA